MTKFISIQNMHYVLTFMILVLYSQVCSRRMVFENWKESCALNFITHMVCFTGNAWGRGDGSWYSIRPTTPNSGFSSSQHSYMIQQSLFTFNSNISKLINVMKKAESIHFSYISYQQLPTHSEQFLMSSVNLLHLNIIHTVDGEKSLRFLKILFSFGFEIVRLTENPYILFKLWSYKILVARHDFMSQYT